MTTDTGGKMERLCAWVESRLGERPRALEAMAGGAGARRYWRALCSDGRSAVVMHAVPEDPAILPPALRAPGEGLPFVRVTRLLAGHAIPVPEIYAVCEPERWVLLEDLGDTRLCDLGREERDARHEEAIDLLARVHALPPGEGFPFDRSFDEEWIRFELDHFAASLPERAAEAARRALDDLARAIAAMPRGLALRDYQSQNLMIDARGRLRVLDYQDALLAPPELDLAALLWDSYVEIAPARREALLARYARAAGRAPDPERFALVSLQRKLKDLGRFRWLSRAKGERWEAAECAAGQAVGALLAAVGRGRPELAGPLAETLRA
jgi:aminoglycoside/choline kinase family phosphotransferase